MSKHTVTVEISAATEIQAKLKAQQLQELAANFSYEAIKLLAEKSRKPGMESKLMAYKHML